MQWLDTGLKILTVFVSLIVALLGAQLWRIRSDNRKINAEAGEGEARASATVTATVLTLVEPMGERIKQLNRTVNDWEVYESEVHVWQGKVIRACRDADVTIPPPPVPPY